MVSFLSVLHLHGHRKGKITEKVVLKQGRSPVSASFTERQTETDRQADRQTDDTRQRERETETETDRQTDREKLHIFGGVEIYGFCTARKALFYC